MAEGHPQTTVRVRHGQPSRRIAYRAYYSVILMVLAWELASRSALINPYFFPPPSSIAAQAFQLTLSGELPKHMAATLLRALTSLTLSVVVGVPLGIAMARITAIRWFFDPLISFGFPIPKIALWPIFVLWFGFHDLSKISLAAVACVFPVISATHLATENVDKYIIWSARNMGTSNHRLLSKIIFRAALPGIMTAIQTVLPIAFVVTVLTEMLSGGVGLGALVMFSGQNADMSALLVGVIAASALGFCTMKLAEICRRRLLIWHEETSIHR